MNVVTTAFTTTVQTFTKAVQVIDDGVSLAHRGSRKMNINSAIDSAVEVKATLAKHNLSLEDIPSLDDWMKF